MWDAATSKWAPADGRRVSGSAFAKAFNTGDADHPYLCPDEVAFDVFCIPDLRGMFLRGLNDFDEGLRSPRDDGRQDPEGLRDAGAYQPDALVKHFHKTQVFSGILNGHGNTIGAGGTGPTTSPVWSSDMSLNRSTPTNSADTRETRPRNVGIYFYVRIN